MSTVTTNKTDHWTVGEPVPIAIVLENEAGVRVREPHSHSIWREPDSEIVRQGEREGIPLRVALKGERTDNFSLSVESCFVGDNSHRAGCTTAGVVLDLSTGKAKGSISVLSSCKARKVRVAAVNAGEEIVGVKSTEAATGMKRAANGSGGGEDNEEIYLLIAFTPEWTARFNRPILPLESLLLRVVGSYVEYPPACGENEAGNSHQLIPIAAQQKAVQGADLPSWAARDYSYNVRRLLFAVHDCYPRRGSKGSITNSGPQWALGEAHIDSAAVPATVEPEIGREPKSERNPGKVGQQCSAREILELVPSSRLLSESAKEQLTTAPAAYTSSTRSGINYKRTNLSSISNPCPEASGANGIIELSVVESADLGGYFGTVWDCSLALGAFVASLGPRSMEGKRVVELGAGCGVVSAVCATLGAKEVVATDTNDLLPLLRLNMERIQRRHKGCRSVEVEEYTWGSPTRDRQALARGRFDVIICSDLFFDPAHWESLKNSFSMLAGGRSSVIYLAHRTRNVQEREFFSSLEGFRCRKEVFVGEGVSEREDTGHCTNIEGEDFWNQTRWQRGCFPDVLLYELTPIVSAATRCSKTDEMNSNGAGLCMGWT